MRRAFGKLMDLLEGELVLARQEDYDRHPVTLGFIAEKYDEPIDRIMDALDAIKERRGEKSYVEAGD